MTNEPTSSRLARIAAALLAVSMAGVTLTAAPAGATAVESPTDGTITVPSGDPAKGEGRQSARTTSGNVAIELPAFAVTPCPELTDSVVRLYSAYFLRAPDEGGFDFWLSEYSAGNWSLPRMSAHFSESQEFVDTYGGITDAEFIDLIYNNIFGRAADAGGRDYWLGRMADEGLDRGTVMLFFSESPEYIELSGTFTPFAGEFNWYPEGTEWFCGFDALQAGLPETSTFVDIAFYNTARSNTVTANLLIDGEWQQWSQATLEQSEWLIFFGQEFNSSRITGLELVGTDTFIWTLVYAPSPTPPVRSGWTAL